MQKLNRERFTNIACSLTAKSSIVNLFFFYILLAISANTVAQSKKYVVYFKDKLPGNSYSVSNPGAFLSAKAISRRTNQNLAIDSTDVPVKAAYIQGVKNTGAVFHYPLKWLNGAIIECTSAQLTTIEALPYVVSSKPLSSKLKTPVVKRRPKDGMQSLNYGISEGQNQMIGIDSMHAWGFHGEGITIAVLDAGFYNVTGHEAFSPLFQNGKILSTKDFVTKDNDVYQDHWHGGAVLSNIAGYLPGKLIGGAFNASYHLLRTEEAATENEIECGYWVVGLEYADSAGADIVNSSLGYYTFDNSDLDYSYATLNGQTSLASRAASMAAGKGMIAVISAGNEGSNGSWGGWITVPSDAENVLAVGAVNSAMLYASFSGKGPTPDGRVKPDLATQGAGAVIADVGTTSEITTNNGTSFSAPILTGLVAGFWQAHPELTAKQVMNYLKSSASQAQSPDQFVGYGIPSFVRAHVLTGARPTLAFPFDLNVYPNPSTGSMLNFELLESSAVGWAAYKIVDTKGKIVLEDRIYFDLTNQTKAVSTSRLAPGIYSIVVEMGGKQFTRKIILQ